MSGEPPVASIVIPSHNEGLNLFLTVHAVEQTADVPFEIIVVDDGSTDGSAGFLRTAPAPHRRLLNSPLVGPAHARNIGANAARGEVVVFLDAHCFPCRGWLSRLVEEVRAHPDDLVTGCISAAGEPSARGWGLTIASAIYDVEWLPRRTPFAGRAPLAGAACLAASTRRFFAIGGFWPFGVIGLEDVELSIRAWCMGGCVRIAEGVEVAHIFADRWRKAVAWADYHTNGLIISHLYLDEARLAVSLGEYARLPGAGRSRALLEGSGVLEKRDAWRARFSRDFGSFCEAYGIAWAPRRASPVRVA